ncbi:MAG TPA: amidohydrolase family protein [Bryobacteraceae bacterium]|nr:amidohydrolase family protein [Bryobacteraceae bacterium]HVW08678.1 amidohydrolase family protein [Bryobacteraceae bacterium]
MSGNLVRESPWGEITVADGHVHLLSHRLLSMLAGQKQITAREAAEKLQWAAPPEDPAQLSEVWIRELDRQGVSRAALIASVPGDEGSVVCAVSRFPERFRGYMMVNPLAERAAENAAGALASGHIHGLCFFPAMHRYSIQDPRAVALIELAAARPGTVVFVHCGVLSVGFRSKLGLPCQFDLRFSNPVDLHSVALSYPSVKFVIPHFGAGMFREALMVADLCPNVFLDTSSSNRWMRYEGSNYDLREVFRRAIEIAGARRLMFGTDSSFFPRGWQAPVFEAQSKALYELGVSERDARRIFSGTFEELFAKGA